MAYSAVEGLTTYSGNMSVLSLSKAPPCSSVLLCASLHLQVEFAHGGGRLLRLPEGRPPQRAPTHWGISRRTEYRGQCFFFFFSWKQ